MPPALAFLVAKASGRRQPPDGTHCSLARRYRGAHAPRSPLPAKIPRRLHHPAIRRLLRSGLGRLSLAHFHRTLLLGLVNRLAGNRLGRLAVPVFVQNALAVAMAATSNRTFVIDFALRHNRSAMHVRDLSAAAGRTTTTAARAAGVARLLAAQRTTPLVAARLRAVLVAVQRRKQSLGRAEIAVAVRSGPLAVALIARVAAIRRIADPLAPIDLAATFAAGKAAA